VHCIPPISHFQRHQSIIETERERDRHNKQNETSTGAIQRGGSHTITRSRLWLAHTSPSEKRDTQAVQPSIMCGKAILRRALELDETQIPSWMHDSFLDEKCFITRNHIDDSSSSSHSSSAEMVVTHRWNPCESRPRHILIRRAHHRSPRDPTHRQQCLESQLRHGSFHADASCLRLGSGAVRLVGAGDNQLDCARLVSLTTVDDIHSAGRPNECCAGDCAHKLERRRSLFLVLSDI